MIIKHLEITRLKTPKMKKSLKYKNQTLIMRRRIRLSRLIIPDLIRSLYWSNRSYRLNYIKSF